MKIEFRFLVFGYCLESPQGGFADFRLDFETKEDAIQYVRASHLEYDAWHIVDLDQGDVIWRGLSEKADRRSNRIELRQCWPHEKLEVVSYWNGA